MPFEPKTDSKESALTNLNSSPTAVEWNAAAKTADLTIRIWGETSGGAAPFTWNSESVLVYMIADLVAASHGRTAVETPDAMSAHFEHAVHGLVAAKRIQTAILEFLACRPGDCIGAAVLLHPSAAAGFSQRMAQSALRLAEPGQIILSHEVAQRFKEFPGIELRPVPALTTGGSEHVGLAELLWTSPERLATLRTSASTAPTANVSAPFGATVIVNAPVAGPDSNHANADVPPPAGQLAHARGRFDETFAEFEEQRSFLTPLRVGIAALAIVIVVVGLMLFHPWSRSKVPPQPPTVENTTGGTPAVVSEPVPPITTPQPPPAAPSVGDSHPKPPVKNRPAVAAKDAVTAKDKDKEKPKKPEDTPIRGFEGNSTYDGMTQKDIPRLLQWARSDAGNGNYAKAAQEYRVILQLQPSNPDAREGLRKIQVARGLDQDQ